VEKLETPSITWRRLLHCIRGTLDIEQARGPIVVERLGTIWTGCLEEFGVVNLVGSHSTTKSWYFQKYISRISEDSLYKEMGSI
jgi:hypothetical protein